MEANKHTSQPEYSSDAKLREIFVNNADYAIDIYQPLPSGMLANIEKVPAMTEDRFISTLSRFLVISDRSDLNALKEHIQELADERQVSLNAMFAIIKDGNHAEDIHDIEKQSWQTILKAIKKKK